MSKKKDKEKAKKQQKWEEENRSIKSFQAQAPKLKRFLRTKGCNLPFYDFLDSYTAEFERIVVEAKNSYPSLVGVHDVENSVYRNTDWSALGYGDYQQIFFYTDDEIADYGTHDAKANLCGHTSAFLDREQNLRTVIIIRKTVKDFEHRELKYVIKIAALLHEVGHVHDIEHGVNFDVQAKTTNIIEAEAFANLFALDRLAERQLVQSYNLLANALRDATEADGYLGEVARRVVQRLPQHKLVVWNDSLDSKNLSVADLKLLKR